MPDFFFLLSGEHNTLPTAELKAILEAARIRYKILESLPQVLRLSTTTGAVEATKEMAALTKISCLEFFCSECSLSEITKSIHQLPLDDILQERRSFVVRVRRIRGTMKNLSTMYLERKIGELMIERAKPQLLKVDLRKPQMTFFGVMTGRRFAFGLKLMEASSAPFMQRRPRKRPFFHPSAMPAKLARCMVNLAGPKKGDILLDPFCGTGGFLIEAGLLGCRPIGFDVQRRMVKGTSENLRFFNVEHEGLGVAEVKHLPIGEVDCIVTDPPYGRSASTRGRTTREIVRDFLAAAADRIARQSRVCLAAPRTIEVSRTAQAFGFRCVQSHLVYVHRSLTREIVVLERI